MIEFHFETKFELKNEVDYSDWIARVIHSENATVGNLNYIFCDDTYLLVLNKNHLDHDTFTDIISFDYSDKGVVSGDIFISIERVRENSELFKEEFSMELLRVMAHGVLHLLGYNDKNENDIVLMRKKENEKIKLFHVEQN